MEANTAIGNWERGQLPDHVHEFIEWLVTPSWEREPSSQNQWAFAHGFHPGTVSNWKKDERVKRAIQKRADELNLAPDRVQEVLNALYRSAVGGDTKAMALYLQHADKLKPRTVVVEDRRISDMSDEQLAEEMRQLIASGDVQ